MQDLRLGRRCAYRSTRGLSHATLVSAFALALVSACISPLLHAGELKCTAQPMPVHSEHQVPAVPYEIVSFDTTEGTAMNLDVSPDGDTIVFDLLGDIYRLPMEGGDAVPLTTGLAWDQAPRFSPDGNSIYFISDRIGYRNIWQLKLSDLSVRQVTRADSDVMGAPNWSQDGQRLLVGVGDPGTRSTEFVLQSINPDSGSMTPIDPPGRPWIDWNTFETFRRPIRVFSGVQSADGVVYFSQAEYDEEAGLFKVRLYRYDLHTRTRSTVTPAGASFNEYKPQLSHDGSLLAYFRQYTDRRTELRILDRNSNSDTALMEMADADDAFYALYEDARPNYAFTPDDQSIVFWHGGKIHHVDLTTGLDEIIPFRATVKRTVAARVQPSVRRISDTGEAKIIRWPSLSRDGRKMAFAAIGYVWLMNVDSGDVRRLTGSNDFEYMPAISPDGRSVAYTSFSRRGRDWSSGRLMVVNVDSGSIREVLADRNAIYMLPKWSRDGLKVALIRELQNDAGSEAAFGWVSVSRGTFHPVAPAPPLSDRQSRRVYARSARFDEAGDHLLFTYPQSGKGTVLSRAALDGDDQVILAIGTSEIGGITPAPDLDNLALTRRDGTLWVIPFEAGEQPVEVSTLTTDAVPLSESGGYYADWPAPRLLTFGFAQNVFHHRLRSGELEFCRIKVAFSKPGAEQPIAFTGARLITMAGAHNVGEVIKSGTIVVHGRRIFATGRIDETTIPDGVLIIDAVGKTIMPGLVDTHYHRIGGRGEVGLSPFNFPHPSFGDRTAIAYGATTAWEPGGAPNDGVPAAVDLQKSGRTPGPRWSHSAVGAVGYPWEQLTSYTSALFAVEQHRELGVDVLKEYATPTRQQRQWLAAAARQSGLGIVSHLQSFDGTMTRIVDGYTGGDHPYIPVPFYKDVHELLKETGYIWTPNIGISPGVVGTQQAKEDYFCHAVLKWRALVQHADGGSHSICSSDQVTITVPYDSHRFSRVARQATLAARGGVHIGVSGHNMPGSNLHQEMWYLWKGGMPTEDVLRATTIGNAKKLGLQEEIGSLEPGKIADFLVLDGNPLDDILNTLSVRYTVQGGVVYDAKTTRPVEFTRVAKTDVAVDHQGK